MSFSLRKGDALRADTATSRRQVATTELEPNNTSRVGVYLFSMVMFAIGFCAVFVPTMGNMGAVSLLCSVLAGLVLAGSIRIAPQWESVTVLRLGKFNRIAGPGLYFLIPIIEYATIHIDRRIITSSFSAEEALTADLVPVDVDAILFWMVWDAEKATLEVSNYPKAVLRSAQTALRDAIGQQNLGDLSINRKEIDRELQEVMGAKCEDWGITVISVEIRDIQVPKELQDALSKEAQAERERNARAMLAEVEKDISEMYVEAARIYKEEPEAMQLRAMNLAFEGAKDSRGWLLAPTNLAQCFDLGKNAGN